jgi:hypothetical protein
MYYNTSIIIEVNFFFTTSHQVCEHGDEPSGSGVTELVKVCCAGRAFLCMVGTL